MALTNAFAKAYEAPVSSGVPGTAQTGRPLLTDTIVSGVCARSLVRHLSTVPEFMCDAYWQTGRRLAMVRAGVAVWARARAAMDPTPVWAADCRLGAVTSLHSRSQGVLWMRSAAGLRASPS